MSCLVDTNVVSELRRAKPDPRVLLWWDGTRPSDLYVSVLTLGELRRGVESLRRRDSRGAAVLEQWLKELRDDFGENILPVTAEIADEWARLSVPDPLPTVDGLLAATALVHGLTLVTRNVTDVKRTGVRVLNPFTK
ncbi:MAG: type II toxin-antitoxin system VapC family toxin [Myxococcaceae bacterium]